jgi:4-hydroxybenzoate polyprenyltransferase
MPSHEKRTFSDEMDLHMKSPLSPYIALIRPYQWMKNIILTIPLFFSGQISTEAIYNVTGAIICFCMASSLGYILNDWMDRERDNSHLDKCRRPFCSGRVSGRSGLLLSGSILLILAAALFFLNLPLKFIFFLAGYLLLTISYSLYLKHVVVLEIFIVSLGFVIRVLAGGAACDIPISDWLFLTVLFMSMLISVTKRKVEFDLLKNDGYVHRKSLKHYNANYLYNYLWTLGGISLVVYSLYTVEKGNGLVYSVVPAAYGIVRFILLTDSGIGGDPIKALFGDLQLLVTTLIFLCVIGFRVYFG